MFVESKVIWSGLEGGKVIFQLIKTLICMDEESFGFLNVPPHVQTWLCEHSDESMKDIKEISCWIRFNVMYTCIRSEETIIKSQEILIIITKCVDYRNFCFKTVHSLLTFEQSDILNFEFIAPHRKTKIER